MNKRFSILALLLLLLTGAAMAAPEIDLSAIATSVKEETMTFWTGGWPTVLTLVVGYIVIDYIYKMIKGMVNRGS